MRNVVLYATTVLIWGSTWLAITYQLGAVDPLLSVGYRFALASLLLLGFCVLTGKPMGFSRRDHLFMLLQGGCLFGGNYWLFYLATGYLTSGLVAICFSTVVFMNILNGRLFLGRPVRSGVLLGAALGLVGIVMVFWPEFAAYQQGDGAMDGVLIGIVATYVASLGNILSARNQANQIPVLQGNAFGMGYGALMMLVLALISGQSLVLELSSTYLGSLLYLSVFGSIIAFGCYLSLIGRIGADRAAYASLLFPIVALQLSVWFEGYQWSALSLMGLSLVLVGNLLALLSRDRWRQLWFRIRGAQAVTPRGRTL